MYENTQLSGTSYFGRLSRMAWFGRRYMDKWGDEWERTDSHTVIRLHDGNVGGWFYGEGLKVITTI